MGTIQRESFSPLIIVSLATDHVTSKKAEYKWLNNSDNLIIHDAENTELNAYHGGASFPRPQMQSTNANVSLGVYQQTTSGLSVTNQDCYELEKGCFAVYGFEYKPG